MHVLYQQVTEAVQDAVLACGVVYDLEPGPGVRRERIFKELCRRDDGTRGGGGGDSIPCFQIVQQFLVYAQVFG